MSATILKIAPGLASRPDHGVSVRIAEALLFASAEPMSADDLARRLPRGADIQAVIAELRRHYAQRGVNLVRVAGRWAFRTAGDLAFTLAAEAQEPRKLSRAAMETLAIVAYHQPATRAEIEEIRGVAVSKGTLDTLIETGWVRMRGRRRTPGRPATFGTTRAFLDHFGLDAVGDLPALDELRGTGFLDGNIPPGLRMPIPSEASTLREDEDPPDDDPDPLLPHEDEDGTSEG